MSVVNSLYSSICIITRAKSSYDLSLTYGNTFGNEFFEHHHQYDKSVRYLTVLSLKLKSFQVSTQDEMDILYLAPIFRGTPNKLKLTYTHLAVRIRSNYQSKSDKQLSQFKALLRKKSRKIVIPFVLKRQRKYRPTPKTYIFSLFVVGCQIAFGLRQPCILGPVLSRNSSD